MNKPFIVILAMLLVSAWPASSQTSLQELLNETALSPVWIYTDVARATAEAQRTGKPLLALFRCVPCQCAASLDRQFVQPGAALEALLERFVCLRVVQMNGVDLQRFQFDRDLSLAVLFMNADGTVYGRYGTRASPSRTEDTHISLPSFLKAADRALQLHANYPANRAQLEAKRGPAGQPITPEALPHLRPFPGKQAVANCIHCHMVGEAQLHARRDEGLLTQSDLWSYPLPENLGVRLVIDDGLQVKAVKADSPAGRIGMLSGDELLALGGQPLISPADIQWVLHHAPAKTRLPVQFRRDGRIMDAMFELHGDWKKSDMYWRESLTGVRNGLFLQTLSLGERQRRGVPPDSMALLVRYAFDASAKAGVRNGDVILAADQRKDLNTEGEFLSYVHLTHPAPSNIKLEILRKGERLTVNWPAR
jgi:serine protease Do